MGILVVTVNQAHPSYVKCFQISEVLSEIMFAAKNEVADNF